MSGILAVGAYIPWRRISRKAIGAQTGWFSGDPGGQGERSWCAWDEDVVTMAVEAARDCLVDSSIDRITAVSVASTTAPYADRATSAIVAQAVGADEWTETLDVGGSYRAGTSALLSALRGASGEQRILCIASEQIQSPMASSEEMTSGDAAAALLIGTGDVVAEFLGGASVHGDFVDHFRPVGERHNYWWESRWIRDEGVAKLVPQAIARALSEAELTAGDVSRFILPIALRGADRVAAQAAGLPTGILGASLSAAVGFSGAAAPLLELASALEAAEAGEVIVISAFGSGADAIVLRRTAVPLGGTAAGVAGWLARKTVDDNYLRFATARGELPISTGMRGEFDQKQSMPALWRNREAMVGLKARVDPASGSIQFPPPAGSAEQPAPSMQLADETATVTTFTADHLAFSLDPPTYYGIVDFESGGRMVTEYCDTDLTSLEVGVPVRMMFRIKAADGRRGFSSYFWKASPNRPDARATRGA